MLGLVITVVVAIGGASLLVYWLVSGDGPRLALEREASAWMGEPVQIDRAQASLFPRAGLELTNVRVGDPVRLTLATVQVSTDIGALLGQRIEDAAVVVADSRVVMPLPLPKGDATSAESSEGASDGVQIVSIREISLRNIQIVSRDREFVVSMDSSLDGDLLSIDSLTAESGTAEIELDGEIRLAPDLEGTLAVRAGHLDLDELLALAQAFEPEDGVEASESEDSASGDVSPFRLTMNVSADTATAGGVEVEQLATQLEVTGTRAVLSPLSFGLFGGRYEGMLDVEMEDGLSVTSESRIEGLDVGQLAAFGGSPDTVSGTLSGEVTFDARGSDLESAVAAARGAGQAVIVDGEVRGLDLLRVVVLFFGRPASEALAASDEFERIEATFSLGDQVVQAHTFAMRSRDADIDGAVTLALASTTLDGSLQLLLSEELSAQAGTDLVRFTQEGNRVVLPATIGGTLDSPKLAIDSSSAVKRGLRNEAERRINRLFGR